MPAPFNSSTFKLSQFDVIPSNTGPGSYNPPYQKDLQSSDKKMQTSVFSSKVNRFKSEPSKDKQNKNKMKVNLVKE